MNPTVLRVDGLSKQYRLGEIGTGSLRHDLNRFWHRMRGKDDPYTRVCEINDRSKKGNTGYVWALRDVTFDVERGEIVGIIGSNGAGKSTLLKILSRTTSPTTGVARMKGRLASLLEVGTGFHGDLTGRENIFLNGAILGMSRQEIARKFDAIVDFSGVERYIDTPVKRYSSGMYVRLAFAVAAHLEPDILIVDEVLAVGDSEFQKKCLGKMKDVSEHEGRTILFVSHNLQALSTICSRGILLRHGRMVCDDTLSICLGEYFNLRKEFRLDEHTSIADRLNRTTGQLRFTGMTSLKGDGQDAAWEFCDNETMQFRVDCVAREESQGLTFLMSILELGTGKTITSLKSVVVDRVIAAGEHLSFNVTIPANYMRAGQYDLYCGLLERQGVIWYDVIDSNVGLPSLVLSASTLDPHLNNGFVSIPFKAEVRV